MPQFTDSFVKNLKPKEKRYTASEGRGFTIQVLPTGTKTFLYCYRKDGKKGYVTLGIYSRTFTLADARKKFNIAYDALKSGQSLKELLNPLPVAEVPTHDEVQDVGITTRQLMELYIVEWSEHNHCTRWSRTNRLCLEKDLMPEWAEQPASLLRPRDAYRLVDNVVRRGPGAARNLVRSARGMYDYGMRNEYVEVNPFALKFSKNSPAIVPQARERVLSEAEIQFIWKAIDEGPGNLGVKRAIKLVLVTGQRPGEVAGMLFSEIEGDWWTIPPNRIKTEKKVGLSRAPRAHAVYLTPLAKELIGESPLFGDIVFPAVRIKTKSISAEEYGIKFKTITAGTLSDRISYRDTRITNGTRVVTKEPYYGLPRWTPHDLRRTASTGMNALGINDRHVEMVLNHTLGRIEGTYNRYQYAEEKKEALLRWEAKLKELLSL